MGEVESPCSSTEAELDDEGFCGICWSSSAHWDSGVEVLWVWGVLDSLISDDN